MKWELLAAIFVVVFSVAVGYLWPLFSLSENQVLYVYSTLAQVVAGVCAIVLVGFVFYNDKMVALAAQRDSTKCYVDPYLSKLYRELRVVIIASGFSVVLSVFTIVLYDHGERWISVVALNSAGSIFLLSIAVIFRLVIKAFNPQTFYDFAEKLERDSFKAIEIGPSSGEYLASFNEKFKPDTLKKEVESAFDSVSAEVEKITGPQSRVLFSPLSYPSIHRLKVDGVISSDVADRLFRISVLRNGMHLLDSNVSDAAIKNYLKYLNDTVEILKRLREQ